MRLFTRCLLLLSFVGAPAHSFETVLPDFAGDQAAFGFMRTRIIAAMQQGPNFDGHYTVITVGCGTQCAIGFVADNKTGKIYDFPYGGEEHSQMHLEYGLDTDSILVAFKTHEAGQSQCVAKELRFNDGEFTEERFEISTKNSFICPLASELFE
ncbi:MAG: hypothetical protein IME92_03640 [Proteobacteria bacterium]|nr:hypothetical protein [Pseudomonadota bacterium]